MVSKQAHISLEGSKRGSPVGQRRGKERANTQNSRTDSYSLLFQKSKKTCSPSERLQGFWDQSFPHCWKHPLHTLEQHPVSLCSQQVTTTSRTACSGLLRVVGTQPQAPILLGHTTESQVPAAAARLTCQYPGFLPGRQVTLGLS